MDPQVRFERLVARLRMRQLKLIAETVALGNLKLAAERCGMTQPAASQGLHDIETLVGTQLFERSPRGMRPTAAGRALAAHARGCLSALHAASRDLSDLESGYASPLRVGTMLPGVPTLVSPALQRLRAVQPEFRVRIIEDSLEPLLDGLATGAHDLLVVRSVETLPPGLVFEPLYADALGTLVRRGHPLLRRRRLTLDDLLGYRWLVPPRPMITAESLHRWLLRSGLQPRFTPMESNSPALIPGALHGTDDVLVAPRSYICLMASERSLAPLPIELGQPLAPLGLLYARECSAPQRELFFAACREAAAAGAAAAALSAGTSRPAR